MWVRVTQCWLECYLYVIYRIFLLTVATEEEWVKVLKRKKSIKKKKGNYDRRAFQWLYKILLKWSWGEPPNFLACNRSILQKNQQPKHKKRIFFLLFWTLFVIEFLYCITRADTLGHTRLFTASSPQSKLLPVLPWWSWVLTQFSCWNSQYLARNSSGKVQRKISSYLQPCQDIKVRGKDYSNHPFLHSVLSLIEKSCSLCIWESPFNKPL